MEEASELVTKLEELEVQHSALQASSAHTHSSLQEQLEDLTNQLRAKETQVDIVDKPLLTMNADWQTLLEAFQQFTRKMV